MGADHVVFAALSALFLALLPCLCFAADKNRERFLILILNP